MKNLSEQQKEMITDAGKAELSYSDVALITDLPKNEVKQALDDPDSEIYKLYRKGKVLSLVEICNTLEKKAKEGNRLAAETFLTYRKEIRDRAAIDEFLGKI